MSKILLTLLDNGLDYIYEGVTPIYLSHDYSQTSLKYSVLHVYSGIQLLLKERLKQEHWSLIFQDINSATRDKLKSGDFISVYHDELIKRLRNLSGITVDEKPIANLRILRNRFEHFEINVSIEECEKILAAALDSILTFWNEHLFDKATPQQREKFNQIRDIVIDYAAYASLRLEKFQAAIDGIKLNGNGLISNCRNCRSLSLAIFLGEEKLCKCFVCNELISKEEYVQKIRTSEKLEEIFSEEFNLEPYERYEYKCSACNGNRRIRIHPTPEATLYFCVDCLHEDTIAACTT